jgi:hypothetical protein
MIVVEIQDPEDGRVSHEIGPFMSQSTADNWCDWFTKTFNYDASFVEVRNIEHRLYDPKNTQDMHEIEEFYG